MLCIVAAVAACSVLQLGQVRAFAPQRYPPLRAARCPNLSPQIERVLCAEIKGEGGAGDVDEMTTVGSSEYYQGFLSRSVDEEPTDRVTGDAVLGPTLKLAGAVSFMLVALTAAFLASNGII